MDRCLSCVLVGKTETCEVIWRGDGSDHQNNLKRRKCLKNCCDSDIGETKESFTLSGKLLPTDKTTMSRYLLEFTKVCFPRYQLLTLWASTHILNLEFMR